MKIYILFSILILLNTQTNSSLLSSSSGSTSTNGDNFTECLIHNSKYSLEYLYSYSMSEMVNQSINLNRNVFLYPKSQIEDFDRIIWQFIQTPTSPTTNRSLPAYFLRNMKTNEYLCSSNKFEHILLSRHKFHTANQRLVYTTSKIDNHMIKNGFNECKWRFEPVPHEIDTYIIINVLRNESLYSGSYFFKIGKYKRNVYLWFKPSKSNEFRWIIDC